MSIRERSSSINPGDRGIPIPGTVSEIGVLLTPGKALSEGWEGLDPGRFRSSAVLVPLYLDKGKLMVLFTERPVHLRRHPGQIGFPGGAREEWDRTPGETALRESREEIGLAGDNVRLLGLLSPEVAYTSDFLVYPVVGWIDSLQTVRELAPNPQEVKRLLPAPLGSFQTEPPLEWKGEGSLKFVYPVFPLQSGDRIWGVTARILLQLVRLLKGTEVV